VADLWNAPKQASRVLGASEWAAAMILAAWSAAAFLGAGDDFSYDYGSYIAYLDNLSAFGADDLWAQILAFLPYPYVLIPPAGFFEVGFALLLWGLMTAGMTAAAAYALVGATSIAIRLLLLRAFGVDWFRSALITIYSVTLFEANAIRLGCALTAGLAALFALRKGRLLVASLLLLLAASFHLQALAFALPVLAAYLLYRWMERSTALRVVALGSVAAASILLSVAPGIVDFAKLNEYADLPASAVGLNAVSIAALVVMATAAIPFVLHRRQPTLSLRQDGRLWASIYMASIPAVAALLLATKMGPLGDRLWQFAFVNVIVAGPLLGKLRLSAGLAACVRLSSLALTLCLLIAVVNVTVRYPLSNFFAPLIPHTPINSWTLII
jgi:hypothetical protein